MTERAERGNLEVTRPEPVGSSVYDDAYRGVRDFRPPISSQQALEQYFGNLTLDQAPRRDRAETPAEALEREVANAKKNIDELMRLSGNKVRGEDGLSKEDLTKLQNHPGLRKDLKDTVDFLLKGDNFEKFSHSRMVESLGGVSRLPIIADIFQRRRITPDSLENYKGLATAEPKLKSQIPPSGEPNERHSVPRKTVESGGPRDQSDRTDRDGYVVVKRGWGWENIARASLDKQGARDYQPRDVVREMERLQRLNPHNVKMVHEGDRIRMRV